MENQHRKIKGYQELNQAEIDLMNEIKEAGVLLKALHEKVEQHSLSVYAEYSESEPSDDFADFNEADPFNWSDEGKQKLQEGLMCLTRAIARPTFF